MLGRGRDLTGDRYGKLVVKTLDSKSRNGTCKWLCVCDCGKETVVFSTALRTTKLNQGTKSCGCIRGRDTTHGMAGTRTYNSWKSMKGRCANPNNPDYPMYGGRGTSFDPTWESFEVFLKDMGARPRGTSLDRIDPFGNYNPENCRWATPVEQANNRRRHQ